MYYHIAKIFIDKLEIFEINYILKERNIIPDLLSKLATTKKIGHLRTIIQETIQTPTIDTKEIMVGEEEEPDWITPYKNFLIRGVFPPNENEAQHLKQKANYYVILNGEQFTRGLRTPLLKCLNNQQENYVMRELHEGICDLYTRGRSLATKVVCAGYYFSTLRVDALNFTKKCRQCHEFADFTCCWWYSTNVLIRSSNIKW